MAKVKKMTWYKIVIRSWSGQIYYLPKQFTRKRLAIEYGKKVLDKEMNIVGLGGKAFFTSFLIVPQIKNSKDD